MSNIKIDWSEAPNWGNAPEWANWTAQNKDGNWHWFEVEPELYDYRFIPIDFTKHQFALRCENTDGWESSLQKKPNEVAIEFFDKLCDDTIDWSEAPEWANWSIQNPHGLWFWIENKPFINDSNEEYEIRQKGKFKFYKKTASMKDWKHTLQERPKPKFNNITLLEITDSEWESAPTWANYAAQNPGGEWFWIEHRPYPNSDENQWHKYSGKAIYYRKTPESKDWTKTLQERPKAILSESRPRFESARVGDKAYSTKAGWGTIINIDLTSGTPLCFKPDNKSLKKLHYYDLYGHSNNNHKESLTPELYWDVPTITGGDIPPERMASIGGYQYPEPEREAPKYSDTFYYPVITGSHAGSGDAVWVGASTQLRILKEGNIHLCRSNALQHSKARAAAIKDMESKNNGTSNSSN